MTRTNQPYATLRPAADSAGAVYDLMIDGDIGESFWSDETVTAKKVVAQLKTLPKSVKTIQIRVNSFGGAVSDGLAIYNALREHPAAKVTVVDGVAISAGSLIAMAGDTIKMPATSLMMIHGPSSAAYGNAGQMRKSADVLDKFAEAMLTAYTRKTGKTADEIRSLLQDGEDHWYTAQEAVDAGFADEIVDDSTDATADFAGQILARAPDELRNRAIAAMFKNRKDSVMENDTPAPDAVVETPVEAVAVVEPVAAASVDVTAAVAAAVAAAQVEAQARVDAALAQVKAAEAALAAEVEAKEVRAAVDVARADYPLIPGRAEDLGPALRAVAKASPDAMKVIDAALRAANGLIAASAKEIGLEPTGAGGPGRTESTEERLNRLTEAKMAADKSLSVYAARTQVYVENPDIVAALRGEGV